MHNVDVATWFGDIAINGTSATSNVLTGSSARETITGHATGDNTIWGGFGGNDTLLGGSGKDTITGNDGSNILSGFGGNDILNGGGNNDALDGGAGDDTLTGGGALNAFRSLGSWTGAGNDSQGWYIGDFNGDGRTTSSATCSGSGADSVHFERQGLLVDDWTPAGTAARPGTSATSTATARMTSSATRRRLRRRSVPLHRHEFRWWTSWTCRPARCATAWQSATSTATARTTLPIPGGSGADVFLSNGSSFVSAGSWTGAGNDAHWYVGDFNGDGKDDIFRHNAGVSGAEVFLSNGSSFISAGSWTGAGNDGRWYVGDFNGDASDDIMRYSPGVSGGEVFLSNGSSFNQLTAGHPQATVAKAGMSEISTVTALLTFFAIWIDLGADMWLSDPLSACGQFPVRGSGEERT